MEALLAVTSVYEAMKNKPSYIERRAMNEKLKPWEAVRQIQEVFQSFEAEVEARLQQEDTMQAFWAPEPSAPCEFITRLKPLEVSEQWRLSWRSCLSMRP